MAKQPHKSFTDQQVRALFKRYDDRKVELRHILGVLGIGRSRFFEILRGYRHDLGGFTVACRRTNCPLKISPEVEQNILKELELEKRPAGFRIGLSGHGPGKTSKPSGMRGRSSDSRSTAITTFRSTARLGRSRS